MTLLESLLDTIIRLDGDALVMHAGEKPYVFAAPAPDGSRSRQTELSSRPLTVDGVLGLLGQMLPHDQRRRLHEMGAIEHEIAAPADPGARFVITAARGVDHAWMELRRRTALPSPSAATVPPASASLPDAPPAVASEDVPPGWQAVPPAAGRPGDFAAELLSTIEQDAAARRSTREAESRELGEIEAAPDSDAAKVVMLSAERPTLKLQPRVPSAVPPHAGSAVEEVLREAMSKRASAVYLPAEPRPMQRSSPMLRIDGKVSSLGSERSVATRDVERFVADHGPRPHHARSAEWTCTVTGVGLVRCVRYQDRSGPGLTIYLPAPALAVTADAELDAMLHALCAARDGLVVVSGPLASGKSTLLHACVDLINRTRTDHVITIEPAMTVVHEPRRSFISQREVSGDGTAVAMAVRAALRERPDVLLIDDLGSADAIAEAFEAARSGRLVFGALAAPTAPDAVARLVEPFTADRRPQARALLAGTLRTVVAQVLVDVPGGGQIAARERLVNTAAVSALIASGDLAQLAGAIDEARGDTLNESLGALVRNRVVDAAEACRHAPDRAALIAALRRDGMDVSDLERRA